MSEHLSDVATAGDPNREKPCPRCHGDGGKREPALWRFVGHEYMFIDGDWKRCWRCSGSGTVFDA